jgi:hypothetical protein
MGIGVLIVISLHFRQKTHTKAQIAKITNIKHQITNKSQTSISNDQNR